MPTATVQISLPLPETLSAEGRTAFAEWSKGPPLELQALTDLPSRRAFIDKLQAKLAARQQRRYPVEVIQSTIAGVPVRLLRAMVPPANENMILLTSVRHVSQ